MRLDIPEGPYQELRGGLKREKPIGNREDTGLTGSDSSSSLAITKYDTV